MQKYSAQSTQHGANGQPAMGSGSMFDRIADRYDLLNRVISLGIDKRWRRLAVSTLDSLAGDIDVLDLATGTGDLAFAVASHRRNKGLGLGKIIATDPSVGMLEVAERKHLDSGARDAIEFATGDAQHLPYSNESFDAVIMSFGIRNVPDRGLALSEMARVTKPGGKVVILELSEPPSGMMGTAARIHVHHIVPRVGALLSGSKEYRYLQQSIAAFPSPERFGMMLVDAGLMVETSQALTFGACHLFVGRKPAPTGRAK
jgi:demethylmenaquinone methyltransferase / 2-methoxy-6-polyprenyl-1,4-benzoquinol methylase